ncbi:MAG: hypothetical protein H0X25_16270 [Acidobacteriales bacterium]|nr:hypothetical protein [Terriglobales bacterium]
MHIMAMYAGPDQVMGVTSGIAGALGVLLLFWNKLAGAWFRMVDKIRGRKPETSLQPGPETPSKNS